MWHKYLLIILVFYLFALLQNSFFMQFTFLGAAPNLIFAAFFLLIFFENSKKNYQIIFLSAIAGIFLDIFSFNYLGPSVVLLLILGFLIKAVQSLLKYEADKTPFVYFLLIFAIFFLAYDFLIGLYLYFFEFNKALISFNAGNFFALVYSSLAAAILFFVYNKFLYNIINNRQLKLFG